MSKAQKVIEQLSDLLSEKSKKSEEDDDKKVDDEDDESEEPEERTKRRYSVDDDEDDDKDKKDKKDDKDDKDDSDENKSKKSKSESLLEMMGESLPDLNKVPDTCTGCGFTANKMGKSCPECGTEISMFKVASTHSPETGAETKE